MSDPTKNGELDQLIEKYRGGEVTRRHFVKVAGGLGVSVAAAGSILAACGSDAAAAPATTAAPAPTAAPATTAAPPPTAQEA